MKMFGNLSRDAAEDQGDRLGGAGILDSAIYTGAVKVAYAGQSQGGAKSVTVIFDLGNREYRETFYVTNKAGENFYTPKGDSTKKTLLPGFVSVDDLCLLTTETPLEEQDLEEKVVNIYDFDQKREVPTNVPVLVNLIGKSVTMGILRQTVDKQAKDSSGEYRNTGETRDENVVDKFFHADLGVTVSEAKSGIRDAVFKTKWAEKNTGVTRDRSKGAEGNVGAPGRPAGSAAGAAAPKATKSLFS
jgi:beta-galactosidase GanA